jgi:hypothetical protein
MAAIELREAQLAAAQLAGEESMVAALMFSRDQIAVFREMLRIQGF